MNRVKHIFIIGSKGIPAHYGGYETFVDNLVRRKKNESIKYHIACLGEKNEEFEINGAHCFRLSIPNVGPSKAVLYDLKALKYCLNYIDKNNIKNFLVYVLTCRIGPFFKRKVKKIHKLGGKVLLNPDGHEWLRSKWPWVIKQYWKISERLMINESDLIICDSIKIQEYVLDKYKKNNISTTYIAYGADLRKSILNDDDFLYKKWLKKFNIRPKEYYLSVGRFVPENNFEIMIREFMLSKTTKDFVLITNYQQNHFYKRLLKKYHFDSDSRIKFVGTVFDEQLLKKIRENAFAYLHGHSVGGTNPSLLEALASTKINILYDVGFNRECGNTAALYFNGKVGDLVNTINYCESLSEKEIDVLGQLAKTEINKRYSWDLICQQYEELFNESFVFRSNN